MTCPRQPTYDQLGPSLKPSPGLHTQSNPKQNLFHCQQPNLILIPTSSQFALNNDFKGKTSISNTFVNIGPMSVRVMRKIISLHDGKGRADPPAGETLGNLQIQSLNNSKMGMDLKEKLTQSWRLCLPVEKHSRRK